MNQTNLKDEFTAKLDEKFDRILNDKKVDEIIDQLYFLEEDLEGEETHLLSTEKLSALVLRTIKSREQLEKERAKREAAKSRSPNRAQKLRSVETSKERVRDEARESKESIPKEMKTLSKSSIEGNESKISD